jgi:hypothetical protein
MGAHSSYENCVVGKERQRAQDSEGQIFTMKPGIEVKIVQIVRGKRNPDDMEV